MGAAVVVVVVLAHPWKKTRRLVNKTASTAPRIAAMGGTGETFDAILEPRL